MFRSSIVAAALVATLGACQASGTEDSATPAATESPAEDVAVSQPVPEPSAAPSAMSAPADDGDECGASKLDRWLNVLPTEDVKTEIAATVGDRPIRYYTQGDAITMDYSPARLNGEFGEDGRIKLFRCG